MKPRSVTNTTDHSEIQTKLFFKLVCAILVLFWFPPEPSHAQQPFVTDDADVTPRHRFHFEFSNEFDILQRSSFPNLKQNTASFAVNYGLFEGVEEREIEVMIRGKVEEAESGLAKNE